MILTSLLRPEPVYNVLLVDPPWPYTGSPTKDQAAGKHYDLMSWEKLATLPVKPWLARQSVVYLWVTGPLMSKAMRLAEDAWGLTYRGQAFVWVKTTKEGKIIHGQGSRPTLVKPTTETVLAYATTKSGRPLPVLDESIGQVVTAPRGAHSEKPAEVQDRIEKLHGADVRLLELFARKERPGWDAWGDALGSTPFLVLASPAWTGFPFSTWKLSSKRFASGFMSTERRESAPWTPDTSSTWSTGPSASSCCGPSSFAREDARSGSAYRPCG